jgi:hypothetical protein
MIYISSLDVDCRLAAVVLITYGLFTIVHG